MKVKISEWVEQLGEKLEALREIMGKKEKEAKEKMKSDYDKKARKREITVGSMVMVRIPGMNGKLEDAWDEIKRKIGKVNHEIVVPGRKNKKKVVHVNSCKQWHQADARVYE